MARQLRKEMTKEERHLWYDFLRCYPVRFSRQKVLGKYIADFYSADAKPVIELDGSRHYEDGNMKKMGSVLLFWRLMVLRLSVSQTMKSAEILAAFVSISIPW